MNKKLILADEVVRLYQESKGKLSVQACINIVKEKCLGVDQNNQSTHEITFKNIVPQLKED